MQDVASCCRRLSHRWLDTSSQRPSPGAKSCSRCVIRHHSRQPCHLANNQLLLELQLLHDSILQADLHLACCAWSTATATASKFTGRLLLRTQVLCSRCEKLRSGLMVPGVEDLEQRKQREAAAKRDPLLQYQLTKPLLSAEDIKQRLEVGAQQQAARACCCRGRKRSCRHGIHKNA